MILECNREFHEKSNMPGFLRSGHIYGARIWHFPGPEKIQKTSLNVMVSICVCFLLIVSLMSTSFFVDGKTY